MAYIITTWSERYIDKLGPETISRRAVATLDEARNAARDIVYEHTNRYVDATGQLVAVGTALGLPESGGTVGPLPDGTVIEVTYSRWIDLISPNSPTRTTDSMRADGELHPERQAETRRVILDAYNAAQGSGVSA